MDFHENHTKNVVILVYVCANSIYSIANLIVAGRSAQYGWEEINSCTNNSRAFCCCCKDFVYDLQTYKRTIIRSSLENSQCEIMGQLFSEQSMLDLLIYFELLRWRLRYSEYPMLDL